MSDHAFTHPIAHTHFLAKFGRFHVTSDGIPSLQVWRLIAQRLGNNSLSSLGYEYSTMVYIVSQTTANSVGKALSNQSPNF